MITETAEKLNHLSSRARSIISDYASMVQDSLGENLVSLILFGSAAGEDFIEGKSDINTVVILGDIRTPDLNIMTEILKKFARKGLATPLMFERHHIKNSLDTFPIEFTDMKRKHILLYGEDPFDTANIEIKNLRYQCEREFKSLLVNLRRGFLLTEGKRENIERLLENSLSSVIAACRGLIWIANQTPPANISDLLAALGDLYRSDTSAIDRVWRLRKGQSGATAMLEALFDDYTNNIESLAAIADRL